MVIVDESTKKGTRKRRCPIPRGCHLGGEGDVEPSAAQSNVITVPSVPIVFHVSCLFT
jgi:hypothetical protein